MKIYLAAPYGKMELMREWESKLHDHGHECTSKWVRGFEENAKYCPTRADAAQMDLDDVDAADVVVSMTLPKGTMFSSGGRHVEFGYGLAHNKLMIIVDGGKENIFHELPQVVICATIEDVIAFLDKA